jgi:hypothetical protein
MATIPNIFNRLFSFFSFGSVKIGGTISTLSEDDLYPTHIANLGYGGHHGYETVADLARMPSGRMQIGMTATVKQHLSPDNKIIKRTTYTLEKELPQSFDRLFDIPNYDISEYWKVESVSDDYSGAFETQYAPNIDRLTGAVDVNGGQPPFPGRMGGGLQVTQAEYNDLPYWVSVYDPTLNHVWQRQRFADSPDANWGIPVKISGESYEQGDYIANIFQRSATQPDTPAHFVNGAPNNNPTGWFDIPPTGTDALWFSKSQKDVYGQLKSPWTTPLQIVLNPLLVRYNEVATPHPNNIPYDDLDAAGWVPIFDSAIHKYMATRQDAGNGTYTLWNVIKIAEESGEYIDYIYKAFSLEEVEEVLDNPDLYRPEGKVPNGWADTPVTVTTEERLFVSSARKFFNGELITQWSDPVPFSGDDTILDVITSNGGDEFKYNKNVTPNTVVPDEIVLTARLYRGTTIVLPSAIEWRKIYNNGQVVDEPEILSTSNTLTIKPEDVTGKAIFEVTQLFQGMSFESEYSILDISDGIDAKNLTLTANSQIITLKTDGSRTPSSIVLKARSSNLSDEGSLKWYKKPLGSPEVQVMQNGNPYLSDELAVNYQDFAGTNEITYRVVSEDGIDDDFTVYQVQEASGGAPAILMILTNESHNLVQDEATGAIDFTGAFTTVKIMEGANDVTNLWSITKLDSPSVTSTTTYRAGSTTEIAMDTRPGRGTVPIQLTRMDSQVSTGFITLTATRGGTSLSKQFSISKIIDPAGAVILDIDSNIDGFTFSPSNQDDKELTAILYIDGNGVVLSDGVFSNLRWYLDDILQTNTGGDAITIRADQVDFQLTVKAVVNYKGINYARTINLTDVKDAKGLGILYTTRSTDGINEGEGNPISDNDKPAAVNPYNTPGPVTRGNVVWTKDSTNAVYLSIRKEDDAVWATPIRIRGEKGEQGETGHFMQNIFAWVTTQPATPTGNPIPVGWSDTPPPVIQGSALWMSIGEVTTATPTVPSQLVGQWSTPVQVSGTTGLQGTAATIRIGSVTVGSPTSVTNSGTNQDVVLNFTLEKGQSGVTQGLQKYFLTAGGGPTFINMSNFAQGTYIDTGNNEPKKMRVKGWVSVYMDNYWVTLKLTRSNNPEFNGGLILQRNYHVEDRGKAMQFEINGYVESSERYIGLTFSNSISGGQSYADYGLEVFILD